MSVDESRITTGAIVSVEGGATAITQKPFPTKVLKAASDFNAEHDAE
jgi:hypothetical protein